MSVLAEMISEQWEFRELLVRMTARDLLLRYKQTVMGFGWAAGIDEGHQADALRDLHARCGD
jgi:hypothetical protein